MELTKEELKELMTQVTTEAVKAAASDPGGTFTPAVGIEDKGGGPRIEVISNPEERLTADPKGGFRNFSEFCHSVYKVGPDGRGMPDKLRQWTEALKKTAGHMEEEDQSQGGYLVPIEMSNQLLQESLELSVVRSRATQIPMASNVIQIPAVVDTTHATGTYFGGVAIYRPGEVAQKTATKPAFGRITLTLHELAGLVYSTNTLIEDSPISIGALISQQFSEAIAFVEDDDFLNGTGVNMALGAFNAGNPSIVAVAAEAGQPADTIVYENIVHMWARLFPRCHGRSVWVANIECFPQIATMSLAVGVGGVPVYMPANGAAGTPFGTLMGRPLILCEKMQAIGDQGDIGLADFSKYYIGEKSGGIQVATSIHIRFDYDETAFRFVLRYDGQPSWLTTLTPRRGAGTLSPFVVLQAR